MHRITPTRELILKEVDGTLTEGERDLLARRREVDREMSQESTYRGHIKDRCARCSTSIGGTWWHYQKLGNFCQTCSELASRIVRQNHR